jgi:hypothetical protein
MSPCLKLSLTFCVAYDVVPHFDKSSYTWLLKSTDYPFDIAQLSVASSVAATVSIQLVKTRSGSTVGVGDSGLIVHDSLVIAATPSFSAAYKQSDFPLVVRLRVTNSVGACVTATSASALPCYSEAVAYVDQTYFRPPCPSSLYRYATSSAPVSVNWTLPRLFASDGREVALNITAGIATSYSIGTHTVMYSSATVFDATQLASSAPVCMFDVSAEFMLAMCASIVVCIIEPLACARAVTVLSELLHSCVSSVTNCLLALYVIDGLLFGITTGDCATRSGCINRQCGTCVQCCTSRLISTDARLHS